MTDTENVKARHLASWECLLNDIREDLDTWHAQLRVMADQMLAEGIVSADQAMDLREIADSAYSHHIEDRISRSKSGGQL